jgi:serine/threonine protein kinase
MLVLPEAMSHKLLLTQCICIHLNYRDAHARAHTILTQAHVRSFVHKNRQLCIVMAFCEGGDLSTLIEKRKMRYFPESEVLSWFLQISLALQYMHEEHILHRDLKTQNIFLTKNNMIKLGDFGIAKVLEGTLEMAKTVIGTPYYMSPELFRNQPYSVCTRWCIETCMHVRTNHSASTSCAQSNFVKTHLHTFTIYTSRFPATVYLFLCVYIYIYIHTHTNAQTRSTNRISGL